MKTASFLSLASVLFFVPHVVVHSHGTEVQHCVTAEGNLRIFVEHWHGDSITTNTAGTMTIRENHLAGQPSITLNPIGAVSNTLASNLPGCEGMATQDASCGYTYNDWVWYDFPTTCSIQLSYTLISGNTVVLQESCSTLYPLTIAGQFSDALAPSIKVDGNDCGSSGYTKVVSDACGPETVHFALIASDDCDASPTIDSVSPASGSMFPLGSTPVTVAATDNTGKTTTCTFTVQLEEGSNCSEVPSDMPSDMPSYMPSSVPSHFRHDKKSKKSSKTSSKKSGKGVRRH